MDWYHLRPLSVFCLTIPWSLVVPCNHEVTVLCTTSYLFVKLHIWGKAPLDLLLLNVLFCVWNSRCNKTWPCTYSIPLAFPFELGPWGQLHFVLLCLGMFHTKFRCSKRWITVLVTNIMQEPRLHLSVDLSHVREDKQTLLKRRKKGGHWALEGQGDSHGHFEKIFGLCQEKSWHFGCWMSDSDYLTKLVESMPRRLAEAIEKKGATTGY